MARVIFDNLTLAQAEMFADWFEGHGEQCLYEWASCQDDGVKSPMTNVREPGWKTIDGEDVTVKCHTPG